MNFRRTRHREDVLFVIALVIPTVLSAVRYFQTERQMMQIVRAQAGITQVAQAAHPTAAQTRVGSILASNASAKRSEPWQELTPPAAYGAL